MSGRLNAHFSALQAEGRAGLITYVMAGDPDLDTCARTLDALVANGADIVELGFPFSDPMADGPIIQQAGQRALANRVTLANTLGLARDFRARHPDTPLILMGYLNPIERMGIGAFAARVAAAGVDGAIVVDLPPEEDHELRAALTAQGAALIRLATPTSDDARLGLVLDGAAGFVYYVSVAGVTGAASANAQAAAEAVARVRARSSLPIAVGFGVRDAATAAEIARAADAVVVGSAIVAKINESTAADVPGSVGEFVASLAHAVRNARRGGAQSGEAA